MAVAGSPARRRTVLVLGLAVAALLAASAARAGLHGEVKSGTAFFVSSQGRLLTSAHVVTDCRRVTIWPPGKPGVRAKVIAMDRDLDVALLAVRHADPHHAMPNGLRLPHANEKVTIIAYGVHRNAPREPELVGGAVTGDGTPPLLARVTVIHARLQAGTSGAPVVNAAGTLLGLIIGHYTAAPEFAVAVSARDLAVFLSRHGIELLPGATQLSDDPAALLNAMSVLVQCVPGPAK